MGRGTIFMLYGNEETCLLRSIVLTTMPVFSRLGKICEGSEGQRTMQRTCGTRSSPARRFHGGRRLTRHAHGGLLVRLVLDEAAYLRLGEIQAVSPPVGD